MANIITCKTINTATNTNNIIDPQNTPLITLQGDTSSEKNCPSRGILGKGINISTFIISILSIHPRVATGFSSLTTSACCNIITTVIYR